MSAFAELVSLNTKVNKLMDATVSLELKYELLILSDMQGKVKNLFKALNVSFEVPESFEPDDYMNAEIRAFVYAFNCKMQELEKVSYMFD